MIGIIYMIGSLMHYGVSGLHIWGENFRAKERGYQRKLNGSNITNSYIDYRGVTRDLDTDDFVETERCYITGDLWLKHGAPSRRVRNLSKEWRDAYYEKMKINHSINQTVTNDISIRRGSKPDILNKTPWNNMYYCEGQWYKDLSNGKLYVERDASIIKNNKKYIGTFYMDIKTRKLIRLSDSYLNRYGHDLSDEIVKEIIVLWNNSIIEDESDYDKYYYNNLNGIIGEESMKELEMMGKVRPKHF